MSSQYLEVHAAPDPFLRAILGSHPEVTIAGTTDDSILRWRGSNGERRIVEARTDAEVAGLVELMDNNPLVCAQSASVPDAASTLALIALGPAIRGSLMRDTPTMACSFDANEELVSAFLARAGWPSGITIHSEPVEMGSILAAKAMVEVHPAATLEQINALYDDAYGRSFYVKRADALAISPSVAHNSPAAFYRIELERDERASLLKVNVLADRNGKCGAAQAVHMFNVMCGFEESLGLEACLA